MNETDTLEKLLWNLQEATKLKEKQCLLEKIS